MNIAQYKRLLLILCIPLLIMGVITAEVIGGPYVNNYRMIRCTGTFSKSQICESAPASGLEYNFERDKNLEWFYVVDYKRPGNTYYSIESSRGYIDNVKIVSVSSSKATVAGETFMDKMIGKEAALLLGASAKNTSVFIENYKNFLVCENLHFTSTVDEYSSICYGDGWQGSVTYRATGSSREQLEKLSIDIYEAIRKEQKVGYIYRFFAYPLFLYAFLFLSFLIWVFFKAVRFVKGN